MRIVRYFKDHIPAVILVVLLLVVQATCDLALPNYTSRIVDVGIQQAGVERVSTEALSARTFDIAAMLVEPDAEPLLRDSYEPAEDGTYALTDYGREHRDELDQAMTVPLIAAHFGEGVTGVDLDALLDAMKQGAVTKDDILPLVDTARGALAQAGDSLVEQQAVSAARAEYESLGYDISEIQRAYLVRVGLSMLGIAAVGMVAAIGVGFLSSRTAAKIGRSLRARLFQRVVAFSDAEVGSFSAASLITRGTNDITLIQNVCVMLQRMVLYAPIVAIGGIVMVTRTNVSMSWIIVLAVVVVTAIVLLLMKVAMPKFKIMQKLIDRVNLVSREILTGVPVIRAFDREQHEEARFEDASAALMKTQLFTNRVMTFMMPLLMLAMNGVSVLIVWVGARYIDQGVIQTGDLIAFITYSMVIIMGFLMISMVSIMLPRANVAAERIDEVLQTQPSIHDACVVRDADLPCTPGARIEFRDVCFAYARGSENVLDHVTFVAEAGETTAVIGATGSGKSTIVKLIERFYDVDSGSICVDGIDIRDISQQALRAQFGYVPQKAFLFSRRKRFCSRGPFARMFRMRTVRCRMTALPPLCRLLRRLISLPRRRRAFPPRSRRAVPMCREDSAKGSPSRAPWRRMRAPICSTTAFRRSITKPMLLYASGFRLNLPARRCLSSRRGSPRSCMQTRFS